MSDHKGSNSSPKRPTSRDIHTHTPHGNESGKNWNYPPGLDNIMATGAFWQNYSGKIVMQEKIQQITLFDQPLIHEFLMPQQTLSKYKKHLLREIE